MKQKLRRLARHSLAILCFFCSEISAQETSTFLEKNLNENLDLKNLPNTSQNGQTKAVKSQLLPDKLTEGLSNLFTGKSADSLMFDEEENNNIGRTIDFLKNNQAYVPEETEADKEQKKQLEDEQNKSLQQKKQLDNEKSYIYLASIMYLDPDEWTVWVNDKKIIPENNKKDNELYLTLVQRDRVKLLWRLGLSKWKILSGSKSETLLPRLNQNNQAEIEFDLKPNQTFILNGNKVVEGRAVAMLKKKEEEENSKPPAITQ